VIEAPDLDAALAIARLNPVVAEGGGVEVRPVHSGFVKRGGADADVTDVATAERSFLAEQIADHTHPA
jgi:hypothetical protein